MTPLPKRLLSIDVFRAITMLLMIFVNDVSGVKNIPGWIEHVSATADGLGFADTIFPAFLFIVGLSFPFAIGNRMNRGDSFNQVALYILSRSLALIVMGFFHVNLEEYSPAAILPKAIWEILITVAFFFIWLDYPANMQKTKKYRLIGIGVAILAIMALLFKGGDASAPEGLKTSWWGILGIIGWGYLVCACIFLLSKGKLPVLIMVLALFFVINLLAHTNLLHAKLLLIGDASSVSLIMAGTIVSACYSAIVAKGKSRTLWTILMVAGISAIVAGLIIRPYADGISKIRSTPAWVFICIGISILVFELLIYLVDVRGKHQFFSIIRPAGTSTLTVYLIPYLLYSFYLLVNFNYPQPLNEGIGGIIRSFAVAFIVIAIAGFMEKKRIRLKV